MTWRNFTERVRSSPGIHPRQLIEETACDLSDLPITVVLAIARQLDVDPGDPEGAESDGGKSWRSTY